MGVGIMFSSFQTLATTHNTVDECQGPNPHAPLCLLSLHLLSTETKSMVPRVTRHSSAIYSGPQIRTKLQCISP